MARHETRLRYMPEYAMSGEPAKISIKQEKLMIMQLQLDIRESWGNRPAKRSKGV